MKRRTRHSLLLAALSVAVVGIAAPLVSWPGNDAIGAPAKAHDCKGALTGRTVTIPAGTVGFGAVHGQPPLPLHAGEYVLSFDDGPTPATTPKLLALLNRACIHATFFMVGKNAQAHPDLAHEIREQGHGIGSHSFSHSNFSTLTAQQRDTEITTGVEAVEKAAYGTALPVGAPRLYRMPGAAGVSNTPPADWMAFLHEHHLTLAGYDFSPQDWRNSPPQESFARLFPAIGDRGVIVMHDWASNTPFLVEMVLAELQKRNAKVVALKLVGDH